MKHFFPLLLSPLLFLTACSLFKDKTATPPAATSMRTARAGADRNQTYAEQFHVEAILGMQRLGIPASITLAQGILESGAGTSELAQNANNHFGIKCNNNWNGATYKKMDDDKDSNGKPAESCFRKYVKVEDSFMDHGQFLRDPRKEQRYGFLFRLDRTDYKGWAEGLEAAGYSTSNTYAEKLIDIIERYKLYEYDRPNGGNPTVPPQPEKPQTDNETGADIPLPTATNRIGRINNVRVVVAREGESITDIAKAYRLTPAKVAEYNDRGYTPIQKLKVNTRVYIESKKDKWTANSASEHIVKPNQTMFDISQLYAVKLDRLLARNRMNPGMEPAEGERIKLKGTRSKKDVVRLRDEASGPLTGTDVPESGGGPIGKETETMTPDDEGLLDEIGGGDLNKPKPAPPGTTTQPQTPVVTAPVPVVTGSTSYPPVVNPGNTQNPPPPVTNPAAGTHLVVKGDTLTNIARRYNTTVARLRQINNLKNDNIQIGQTLRVK